MPPIEIFYGGKSQSTNHIRQNIDVYFSINKSTDPEVSVHLENREDGGTANIVFQRGNVKEPFHIELKKGEKNIEHKLRGKPIILIGK